MPRVLLSPSRVHAYDRLGASRRPTGQNLVCRLKPIARRAARQHAASQTECAAAGGSDLYAVLGVAETATKDQIKSAYRKKALKFHPDVNKAVRAVYYGLIELRPCCHLSKMFMRGSRTQRSGLWKPRRRLRCCPINGNVPTTTDDGCAAYKTASQCDGRKAVQTHILPRPLQGGGGSFDWVDFGRGAAGAGGFARRAGQQAEEAFYGLGDFFNDLEKEVGKRSARRSAQGPKSLWEELAEIGVNAFCWR